MEYAVYANTEYAAMRNSAGVHRTKTNEDLNPGRTKSLLLFNFCSLAGENRPRLTDFNNR